MCALSILREDLPRYERDAALSAEQARLNSHDDMFASYAKEQQAQLDILRARLADAEAGKVELPEPATLDALYEREVARQRATDEGGASSADEFATAAGEAIRETPDLRSEEHTSELQSL